MKCPKCGSEHSRKWLSYDGESLICENCGHEEKVGERCPECEALGGSELSVKGRKRLEKLGGEKDEN